MTLSITRREAITAAAATAAVTMLPSGKARARQDLSDNALPYDKVREFVLVAHQKRRIEEWKGMLNAMPALANATMDWRHGDFETALGAASHMGFPEHAEFLLDHGARMDCFCAAMLGKMEIVQAMVEADARMPFVLGPHGFTLMFHARRSENENLTEYLVSVGADDAKGGWTFDKPELYEGTYAYASGATVVVRKDDAGYVLAHSERGELRVDHVQAHQFVLASDTDEQFNFRMTGVGAWGLQMRVGEEKLVGVRQ